MKKLQPAWADQARMPDAIAAVADHMQQRRARKVLLLISERRDRGSASGFQQATEAVERQVLTPSGRTTKRHLT